MMTFFPVLNRPIYFNSCSNSQSIIWKWFQTQKLAQINFRISSPDPFVIPFSIGKGNRSVKSFLVYKSIITISKLIHSCHITIFISKYIATYSHTVFMACQKVITYTAFTNS